MTKLGEQLENERAKMIKEAKKQPGVAELMRVYNDYAEHLAKMQVYLRWLYARESYFLSDNTEQNSKWERDILITRR